MKSSKDLSLDKESLTQEEALLVLRADIILAETEKKLRKETTEVVLAAIKLKAYYMSADSNVPDFNPFLYVEHPYKGELVRSYNSNISDLPSSTNHNDFRSSIAS